MGLCEGLPLAVATTQSSTAHACDTLAYEGSANNLQYCGRTLARLIKTTVKKGGGWLVEAEDVDTALFKFWMAFSDREPGCRNKPLPTALVAVCR